MENRKGKKDGCFHESFQAKLTISKKKKKKDFNESPPY